MPRTLILTQFFPPEIGAAAVRMSELAERLHRAGDEVDVVTGLPNYPSGRVPREYRDRARWEEEWRGVRVHRAWLYAAPTRGRARRLVNHASFAGSAVLRAIRLPRPDVVLVNSPPLPLAAAAIVVARSHGAPLVVMVADLHPESAVSLGFVPSGPLESAASWVANRVYRSAAGIVALTEGVAAGIRARGTPAAKVRVIRGGADVERFGPHVASRWRERHGLDNAHVFLYAGTLGSSQALFTIRDAAALLRDLPRARVVLMGDGPLRGALERDAPDGFLVLPPEPPEAMPEALAGADACIVTLRDLPLLKGALPAKLYEAMAAGRPVLLSAPDGEATELVRRAGCGIVVPPEDAGAIADAMRAIADDPERAAEMGRAGRAVAERELSRDAMAERVRDYLGEVIARRARWPKA